jgi:hypothetical protein
MKSWELQLFQSVMSMTLVNGYLSFNYLTDKEMTLLEFTNSVALAMCATVVEGSDEVWRHLRAARGRRPSMHRRLEVILATYRTLFSMGERSALAEPWAKVKLACASTSIPRVCVKDVLQSSRYGPSEAFLGMLFRETT